MPFILKHKATGLVFTCMLVNHYQLPYYGTKFWDTREEAEQQYESFLMSQHEEEPKDWSLMELTENQLKLCNVKLKNDARLSLRWYDEKQTALAEIAAGISPSES